MKIEVIEGKVVFTKNGKKICFPYEVVNNDELFEVTSAGRVSRKFAFYFEDAVDVNDDPFADVETLNALLVKHSGFKTASGGSEVELSGVLSVSQDVEENWIVETLAKIDTTESETSTEFERLDVGVFQALTPFNWLKARVFVRTPVNPLHSILCYVNNSGQLFIETRTFDGTDWNPSDEPTSAYPISFKVTEPID